MLRIMLLTDEEVEIIHARRREYSRIVEETKEAEHLTKQQLRAILDAREEYFTLMGRWPEDSYSVIA